MRKRGFFTFGLALAVGRAAEAADAADAVAVSQATDEADTATPDVRIPLDIDGTWVLDRTASDDLEPLLEAQGVPYLERKVVDGLAVTQVITHQGDVLTIDLHTVYKSVLQTLIVDGVVRNEPREDGGGFIELSHHWEPHALVTIARGLNRQDEPFKTTTRRTLQDGGATLVQVTELVRADGTVVTVRRVYRRRPED